MYEIHPAAEIFPLMTGDQFQGLVEDIRENGLLEPIILFEGKILDGRNRLRACEEAGIEPHFTEVIGVDPTNFVISRNLHRRHLTVGQRCAIALDLFPALMEQALERRRIVASLPGNRSDRRLPPELEAERGATSDKLASMFAVGRSSIEKARAIQRSHPEVIEKMRSGEIRTVDAGLRAAGMFERAHQHRKIRGDRFHQIVQPVLRYLDHWATVDHTHINPSEAKKRLKAIERMRGRLDLLEEELERRAVKAKTTV